jgi:hypothetical protein
LVKWRAPEILVELVIATGEGANIVQISCSLVSRTNVLMARADPDATDTVGIHVLEWTILVLIN